MEAGPLCLIYKPLIFPIELLNYNHCHLQPSWHPHDSSTISQNLKSGTFNNLHKRILSKNNELSPHFITCSPPRFSLASCVQPLVPDGYINAYSYKGKSSFSLGLFIDNEFVESVDGGTLEYVVNFCSFVLSATLMSPFTRPTL